MNLIYLDKSFIIYIILIILTGSFNNFILYFILIIIHETGHIISSIILKIKIKKIKIYSTGGVVEIESLLNTPLIKELIILLSGVILQNIGCLLIYKITKINKILFYNRIITIFNLLPIYPLDGGKILNTITNYHNNYLISHIYTVIISIISLLLLNIYNLNIYNVNITTITLVIISKLIIYIKNYKYEYNKFLLERLIYKIKFKKNKKIKNIKYLYKDNYHYINNIEENIYLKKYYKSK